MNKLLRRDINPSSAATRRVLVAAAVVAALPMPGVRARVASKRQVRIGVLSSLPLSAPEFARIWDLLFDELSRRGWTRGHNLELVERAAMGRPNDQVFALADELVAANADLIITSGTLLTQAAIKATRSIPIVTSNVVYPVELGLVASLARPGGNLTGVATQTTDLAAKNFEMLRELVPQARRAGVIWNPSTPSGALAFEEQRAAAARLGLELVSLPVGSADDVQAALAEALRAEVGALMIHPNPAWWRRVPAAWGVEHRVAIIAPPARGYLFDLGPDWNEVTQVVAELVDSILRGADPATLPMRQPTRFTFTLNIKTARALGLDVPAQVRVRATEVIE